MKEFSLRFSSSAEIRFVADDDLRMEQLSTLFEPLQFDRVLVIADERPYGEWKIPLTGSLDKVAAAERLIVRQFGVSERIKSLKSAGQFLRLFEELSITRYDLIVCVGGGAILDVVGFVCSVYMRGIRFVAIPTTLIGQIDAITAGKTCVNSSLTKNIFGTFYYPAAVYNNTAFFSTLENRTFRQGVSEALKYGLLTSSELVRFVREEFRSTDKAVSLDVLQRLIFARAEIRQEDPLASNLGHTFGQALERLSEYSILHGDAIAIGTIMAIYFGTEVGVTKEGVLNRVLGYLKELRLNYYVDESYDAGNIIRQMMKDKKSSASSFNLILIEEEGVPYRNRWGTAYYEAAPALTEKILGKVLKEYSFQVSDLPAFLEQETI